ncbi:MAG: tRNA dihydrouridine synthase DusB, partial [Clostridia bacterium]|nr:tRNA dihydrouridine synthase DusB [Clostridia bacterium]
FREIKQGLAGRDPLPADPLEIQELCLRHARLMAEWKGEDRAVIEMRKHFAWYLKGLRGAAQVRSRINTMDSLIDVENTIREYFQSLSDHD